MNFRHYQGHGFDVIPCPNWSLRRNRPFQFSRHDSLMDVSHGYNLREYLHYEAFRTGPWSMYGLSRIITGKDVSRDFPDWKFPGNFTYWFPEKNFVIPEIPEKICVQKSRLIIDILSLQHLRKTEDSLFCQNQR